MPNYDRICQDCQAVKVDCLERIAERDAVVTCACGGAMHRGYTQRAAMVIQDSIEGGLWIRNGLCHPDGSPKRYDSRTEIRAAERATGWTNAVEHKPEPGSDKSKHTTSWAGMDPQTLKNAEELVRRIR